MATSTSCHQIGWGLSAHLPYYLFGVQQPVSAIIDKTAQQPSALCHYLPVVEPHYLAQCSVSDTAVIVFSDAVRYGAEIRDTIRQYGDFSVSTAAVWAEAVDVEPMKAAIGDFLKHLTPPLLTPIKQRAVLFVNQLDKGGAERQLVLLARGLRQLGWEVCLVTQSPDGPESTPWSHEVVAAGASRCILPDSRHLWHTSPPSDTELHWLRPLCKLLRPRGSHNVLTLSRLLQQYQPELLISYLDDCNIPAAIASLIVGTPRVLLGGRSLAPHCLWDEKTQDYFITPMRHLAGWYQQLLRHSQVTLFNNSAKGARSYDQWLGLPYTQAVVPNAIEPLTITGSNIRQHYQLGPNDLLVIGIMRLSHEKNPAAFVRVVAALAAEMPHVKAILLGDGPLRADVESLAFALGLTGILHFTGKQPNPGDYFAQADLLLATSDVEGFPNVLLEAQIMGCPFVATKVGGTDEAVHPQLHNQLVPAQDIAGLIQISKQTLQHLDQAKLLMKTVQQQILNQRTVKNLAEQTITIHRAQTDSPQTMQAQTNE